MYNHRTYNSLEVCMLSCSFHVSEDTALTDRFRWFVTTTQYDVELLYNVAWKSFILSKNVNKKIYVDCHFASTHKRQKVHVLRK